MSIVDERLEKVGKGLEETRDLRLCLKLNIGTIVRYFIDGEKPLDLKGTYCEPRIVNYSPLTENYNPESLEFQISDMSLNLANGDRYFSRYPFNHQWLIGADADVLVGYEDIEFSNWKKILEGKIKKVSWQNSIFHIDISDSLKKLDRPVPDITVGTNELPQLDPEYEGRPIQYFWGDWTRGTTSWLWRYDIPAGNRSGTYWTSGGNMVLVHNEGTLLISPDGLNWEIGTVAQGTRFRCLKQFGTLIFVGDEYGNIYKFSDVRMRTWTKTFTGTFMTQNIVYSMEKKTLLGTDYLWVSFGNVLTKTPNGYDFEKVWKFDYHVTTLKTDEDEKYLYATPYCSIQCSENGTSGWIAVVDNITDQFFCSAIFGTTVCFGASNAKVYKVFGTRFAVEKLEDSYNQVWSMTKSYKYLYAWVARGGWIKLFRSDGQKWEKIYQAKHSTPVWPYIEFFKNKLVSRHLVCYREPTTPGGNFEAIPISNDRRKWLISRQYVDKLDVWLGKVQLDSTMYLLRRGTVYNFGTRNCSYIELSDKIPDDEIGTHVVTFCPQVTKYGENVSDVLKNILTWNELGGFTETGTTFDVAKNNFPNAKLNIYMVEQRRLGQILHDIAKQTYGIVYFEGGIPQFRIFKDIDQETVSKQIDQNDILEFQLERTIDQITNEITVYHSYNEAQKIYRSILKVLGTAAYLEYGIKQPITIHGKYLVGTGFAYDVAVRYLNDLQVGYYCLRMKLPLKYIVLHLGDVIQVTYDEGSSQEGGFTNKRFRMYSIKKDFADNSIEIEAISPIEMYALKEDYKTVLSTEEHLFIAGTTY